MIRRFLEWALSLFGEKPVTKEAAWPFPTQEAIEKAKAVKKKPCVAKATTRVKKDVAKKATTVAKKTTKKAK